MSKRGISALAAGVGLVAAVVAGVWALNRPDTPAVPPITQPEESLGARQPGSPETAERPQSVPEGGARTNGQSVGHGAPPPTGVGNGRQGSRHLSQAEAVRRANEFCKTIGVTLAQPPVAVFPSPNEFPDQQAVYWGERWNLKYPDGTEMDVADGSGIVTKYFSEPAINTMGESRVPALSESAALKIANRVRVASGQLTELGEPKARLHDMGSPGKQWRVTWPRVADGTAYSDQNAEVTMVGPTGAIIYYVVRFRSPAAATGAPLITQTQAEATAGRCLKEHGVHGTTLKESRLQVVQPNRKWESGEPDSFKGEEPIGGPARKAWVCSFTIGSGHSARYYSVYIDAQSGEVIGGQMWSMM